MSIKNYERIKIMGQNNNSSLKRKKRAAIQQSIITLSCLAIMVFVLVWAVDSALTARTVKTWLPSAASSRTDTSSVGSGKADSKTSEADASLASKNDSDTSSVNDSSKDDASSDESSDESSETSSYIESTDDDFADAVFIGDSRTVGLGMNTDKPKATFYASIGMNVSSIETDQVIQLDDGSYGTVFDALKQHQFKRVFIMFGINEMGWPYPDVFQEEYETVINQVKEIQPDAVVYVQSILPVSSLATSTNAVFTNENVENFNLYVQNAAANTGSVYLDVASALKDENGALPLEASTDGIHLIKDYCMVWMNYLAENT